MGQPMMAPPAPVGYDVAAPNFQQYQQPQYQLQQPISQIVSATLSAAPRHDGFPSAAEVANEVEIGDLNVYACQLEDQLQATEQELIVHQEALNIASGENLQLREMLTNPEKLSGWAEQMFGAGGPFDVTGAPEYQQFERVFDATTAAPQAPLPPGMGGMQQSVQPQQAPIQVPATQPYYPGMPAMQPGRQGGLTPDQQQAIAQAQQMQTQAQAQQQQMQLQAPIRQGFPATPTPAAPGNNADARMTIQQIMSTVPPQQRYQMLAQISPDQMRQLAPQLFQF